MQKYRKAFRFVKLNEEYFGSDDEFRKFSDELEEFEKSHKPIYDVAAGQGRINDGYADEFVEEEEEVEDGYSWCRICGDSMYPILRDGDKVKVRHQTQTEPTDLTVVKINGDEATCKYVQITDNGVWLRAENKEVFADRFYTVSEVLSLPITIIGKVVQMQRSF